MKIDDVMALLKAGFTKDEISAMDQPDQEQDESHEQEQSEKKKTSRMAKSSEKKKGKTEEEQEESTSGDEEEEESEGDRSGDSELESLRSELSALRESLHLLNIQRGGGKESKDISAEIAEQWSRNPYEERK